MTGVGPTERALDLTEGDRNSAWDPGEAKEQLGRAFRQALAQVPGKPSISEMARYLHIGRSTLGEAARLGAGSHDVWVLIDQYVGAHGRLVEFHDEIEARIRPKRADRPNPGQMHAGGRARPPAGPGIVVVEDCPHCKQPVRVVVLVAAAQEMAPGARRPAHLRSTQACLTPAVRVRRHVLAVWAFPVQLASLRAGGSAPDAVAFMALQRAVQAVGAHLALHADPPGLGCAAVIAAAGEERLRVGLPA